MKIFGHYIFENSPERKAIEAYKQELEKQQKQKWASACESGRLNDIAYNLGDVGYSSEDYTDMATTLYSRHMEQVKYGRCHKFNNKRYCYHTSKGEIVTDL